MGNTETPTDAADTSRQGPWNAIRRFLERGCRHLDSEDYASWLAMCADDFQYIIQTYSQEIRREVILLDQDLKGLRLLLDQLPMHERYKGFFRRMLGWTDVTMDEKFGNFLAESAVCVYHVDLHGESQLYCTARYRDELRADGADLVLLSRIVLMDTRKLPFGSHAPI